jgi:phosphoenolpyruvate synthase/pyruvate phosphate dikinase
MTEQVAYVKIGLARENGEIAEDLDPEMLGLEIDEPVDLPSNETDLRRKVAKVRAALITRLGEGVLDDPWAQLFAAIGAVFASWNSPRALAYRARAHVEDANGTAVMVQVMVFGNLDGRSGTGVAFTRNPSTGDSAPCERLSVA